MERGSDMTGVSASVCVCVLWWRASTVHRADCQLDGRTRRYKIHMVPFESVFPTAVRANPLWPAPPGKCCQQHATTRTSSFAAFPSLIYSLRLSLIHLSCHLCLVLFISAFPPTPSLPSSSTCHQQVCALEAILLCINAFFFPASALWNIPKCIRGRTESWRGEEGS